MPSKTIHIVLETGTISGGVQVVGQLANGLARRGWEVKIWSLHEPQTMEWFPLDGRIEWISFLRSGTQTDYDQLAAVLKKQDGYKLATYWATAFAVAYAAKPDEGLYLVQDIEVVYAHGPLRQAQVMKTYDLGLRALTTSHWVEQQLGATYIGIGLDPYFQQLSKAKRGHAPIACARRQALKGWTGLAEAARLLEAKGYPLITFGQDPQLAIFAQHRHIHNPDLKQLRSLYNTASAFLSTSLHEGLSLTPLEAMACGCPVVMTDADGNMEYARDGENCLIAPDIEALVDGAVRIIREPDLAAKLAYGGAATASHYQWGPVINRLVAALT